MAEQANPSEQEGMATIAEFLHQFGSYVMTDLREQIKEGGEQWLANLKGQYLGQAYVDRLEKNAIYYAECWKICTIELRLYIQIPSDGFSALSLDQLLAKAKEKVQYHQNYIHNGCRDCPVHIGHEDYDGLKELYEAEEVEEYIEELEFSCLYYKACFQIARLYVEAYQENREAFEPLKAVQALELEDYLMASVKAQASLSLDAVELELETGEA